MKVKDAINTIPKNVRVYIIDFRTSLDICHTTGKSPEKIPKTIQGKQVIDHYNGADGKGNYIEFFINNGKPRFELEY
ncbi:MAG: hypothetical protein IJP08_03355 [Bacteroidaceae bacterium]|nr:hypothetical protein [Bacteroidaceae bacterium]